MTDLQTQVEEWTAKGLELGWMVTHKGVTVLTEGYYNTKGQKPPAKAPGDWRERYLQFIKDSDIPYRLPIGNLGDTYTVNAFSRPGLEAFAKCMKEPGMDYNRLVAATKAHYADPRANRKTITNYFVQEWWVSVYHNYNPGAIPAQPFNIEL